MGTYGHLKPREHSSAPARVQHCDRASLCDKSVLDFSYTWMQNYLRVQPVAPKQTQTGQLSLSTYKPCINLFIKNTFYSQVNPFYTPRHSHMHTHTHQSPTGLIRAANKGLFFPNSQVKRRNHCPSYHQGAISSNTTPLVLCELQILNL